MRIFFQIWIYGHSKSLLDQFYMETLLYKKSTIRVRILVESTNVSLH